MQTWDEGVGEYYCSLIDRCDKHGRPDRLPKRDQLIYWIGRVQFEILCGGFDCVFDQCLREADLRLLIEGFRQLEEPELAEAFDRAYRLLTEADFFGDDRFCCDLDASQRAILGEIEVAVCGEGNTDSGPLWQRRLSEKLAKIVELQLLRREQRI